MISSLRELIKRVCITFLIVLGCVILFAYVFALIVGMMGLLISDISASIVMSLLNSSTLLFLYSKKKLSFKQSLIRYAIVFILTSVFTLLVIIYL